MVLKRRGPDAKRGESTIGVDKIFDSARPIFIAITSGPNSTTIYADGRKLRVFPGYRLGRELTGQLVIGTSPVRPDGWLGTLKRLAIYDKELSAESVSKHFESWARGATPEVQNPDGMVALYFFSERSGNYVHNRINPGLDLQIPSRFVLLHQTFLKPFWQEFGFTWDYLQDSLLNVIGFVPLGLVFYLYWTRARPMRFPVAATVLLGFAVSLTIEVLQSYLPTRNSGTTDLFTNTLGTFVGVVIYRVPALQRLISRLL